MKRRWPVWLASGLMILMTIFWTYWGAAEMYHEGWWGTWLNRLPYLAPIALTLLPTLLAFRWPRVGGLMIMAIGIFAMVMFGVGVAVIGLIIALLGLTFLLDGIRQQRSGMEVAAVTWFEHWRVRLAVGLPVIVFAGASAWMLPVVLTRVDDGVRTARVIVGNGVALEWAPEGPGWNWQQSWGGYPSWQDVALYGHEPQGMVEKPGYGRIEDGVIVYATAAEMQATNVCRYLSSDGLELLPELQDSWRMPTADEIVRSLGRHGENAGCVWNGVVGVQAECEIQPDKESPLWSTDLAPIYYWTVEETGLERGVFVSFNGWVNAAGKTGGNPRHSYRCVRVLE